jgi:hypothetical protein
MLEIAISGSDTAIIAANQLGGPTGLRAPWRPVCGASTPVLRTHRHDYGLVARAPIRSQTVSPSSRVLMDYLGLSNRRNRHWLRH